MAIFLVVFFSFFMCGSSKESPPCDLSMTTGLGVIGSLNTGSTTPCHEKGAASVVGNSGNLQKDLPDRPRLRDGGDEPDVAAAPKGTAAENSPPPAASRRLPKFPIASAVTARCFARFIAPVWRHEGIHPQSVDEGDLGLARALVAG